MYDLFVRVPSSVDFLRDAISERIKSSGNQLISNQVSGQADPPAFVGFLRLRDKFAQLRRHRLGRKEGGKRMRESFENS